MEEMARVVDRTPLPQALVDWLKSESGRKEVETCVLKSQTELKRLHDARQVKPEHLHAPITI
ncbi:hypothetical protein A6M27_06460 [Acidithiobacillus thiooxidans]|uniref:Uncharacterized protein n=1 Tax=Acidithiobacillus thiooxidans TaxID=930 RepID=A0A1C2INJ6_ACITH|nr:hypothetical protein A6P07_04085 [Acidithiobacillus thiooxidans]OCX77549.1 hypothetical protein A6O24_06370 [Acidithiobacillus thiooxidans]OCX79502.1 hypothetical protein A6O26_16265 [Acidithiobacillus thiooxidans]OCX88636.1 hypothetical protein A6M27_06460 [Acidithiobacillus thiooxidans]OFC50341.1 hypothetical protein BAE47_03310 [Acidithiobacillus thiooxidans]